MPIIIFLTIKCIFKIKRYCVSLNFKTNRLMYTTLSRSCWVDSFMGLFYFVISHICLCRKSNGLLPFLRLRNCFTCILFFQINIYLFHGYLSKIILILDWQDNEEKPCLTLSHEFSRHIHQPEDKVIRTRSFIRVLTFFQTLFDATRKGEMFVLI